MGACIRCHYSELHYVMLSAVACGRSVDKNHPATSVQKHFSEMEDEKYDQPSSSNKKMQGFVSSLGSFYRRWFVLEPTIFLFLVTGRMVYFTRQNLFIDVRELKISLGKNENDPTNQVVCAGMKNMTEAQCDNPTNETKKMVLNLSQTHFNPIFFT